MLPQMQTNLRARISGLVTASDASEAGGGVCAGDRVTAIGHQIRLQDSFFHRKLALPSGVLVFDWCGGIGSLRRALDLECDILTQRVYRATWGMQVLWPDLYDVRREHRSQLLSERPMCPLSSKVAPLRVSICKMFIRQPLGRYDCATSASSCRCKLGFQSAARNAKFVISISLKP